KASIVNMRVTPYRHFSRHLPLPQRDNHVSGLCCDLPHRPTPVTLPALTALSLVERAQKPPEKGGRAYAPLASGLRGIRRRETMKRMRTILKTASLVTVLTLATLALPLPAHAWVRIGVGLPLLPLPLPVPVVTAPAPAVVVPPAPVVVRTGCYGP